MVPGTLPGIVVRSALYGRRPTAAAAAAGKASSLASFHVALMQAGEGEAESDKMVRASGPRSAFGAHRSGGGGGASSGRSKRVLLLVVGLIIVGLFGELTSSVIIRKKRRFFRLPYSSADS